MLGPYRDCPADEAGLRGLYERGSFNRFVLTGPPAFAADAVSYWISNLVRALIWAFYVKLTPKRANFRVAG